MSFSKRYGYEPPKPLQFECMDNDLKMAIHNTIFEFEIENSIDREKLYYYIWGYFFNWDLQNYDYCYECENIKKAYFKLPWNKIYDYIEFYFRILREPIRQQFITYLNITLEQYNSAYRFVNGQIVQITNEQEIAEIEEAANTGKKAIDYHLNRAIEIFANREKKDYVNTIKEAISAVEVTVNLINKTEGKTLGDALKELITNKKIHPALCEAFSKIYGYTSDKNTGIRHSIFDGTKFIPDFTDAKYMLVACSAFINYLLAKAGD